MLDRITEEVDKQCPMRSFHIQNYKPSWITDELIEQGKETISIRKLKEQKMKMIGILQNT